MKKHLERNQLIITLVVVFVALTLLSIFTISTFTKKSRADAIALGQSVMIQEHEQVTSYMTRAMDTIQGAAINIELMMRQKEGNKKILDFLRNQTIYYSKYIDENFTGVYGYIDGEYLDGTDWVPEEGYVPKERVWYTAAAAGDGKPVIVDPYLDAKTGSIMLSISVMLYDKESVISIDIIMDKLQEIAETITLDGKGYGFICDSNRLFIAHSDPKLRGTDFSNDLEMSSLFEKIFAVEGSESFEFKRNGIDCTVFADNVLDDWYDVVVINNDMLYKDTLTLTFNSIIASVGIYLLIALFSIMLYRRTHKYMKLVEESAKKIEHVTNSSFRALARAIDAKDKYTQGHSLRVAYYSNEIAKRLGKDVSEQNEIYRAALLHDIGKIRIPDDIINKPGKLTDEEYDCIKLHTVSGYNILKDISDDRIPALCAKWHHERYDGRGYPSGIRGTEIPEYARIIAVADSYDAMASNRSYRQALPQAVVRGEIAKGKGSQFDPVIADVMLEIIDNDVNYDLKQTDDDKKQVLIADKNDTSRELLASAFTDEPLYDVTDVNSGEEAIRILSQKDIDVIVLDESLADKTTAETISEIRRVYHTPVLLVVNKKDSGHEMIKRLNVSDYIPKPVSNSMLLEMIHGLLY